MDSLEPRNLYDGHETEAENGPVGAPSKEDELTDTRGPHAFAESKLLALLPEEALRRIRPHLEKVYLEFKKVLYEPNEPIEYVYFPINGVGSIVTIMEDGSIVEVGTVGNEGMIGVPVLLGADSMPGRTLSQIPGDAWRMEATKFREALQDEPAFREVMQLYLQALLTQVAQSTACNRIHPTTQRCARWLLMTYDRVGADEFPLTQEFLSQMLGVRRATVSEVAADFQSQGIIRYNRGRITVLDRKRLEEAACECYAIVKGEFDRLLGIPGS